jgi:hypothetical protein
MACARSQGELAPGRPMWLRSFIASNYGMISIFVDLIFRNTEAYAVK